MPIDIAIIGMAGRFPGARNPRELWEQICAGKNALAFEGEGCGASGSDGDVREDTDHWVSHNSLLSDVATFDAKFFGFSPREATITDPQHRVFLECAWEALEDGGLAHEAAPKHVGVFAGGTASSYYTAMVEPGRFLDVLPALIGNEFDYIATRASHVLQLSGPAFSIQSGCSTSLVATHVACQALKAGECDAALAGGVSIPSPRANRHYYMSGGMLSPEPRVRPFDAAAKGTVFAEGSGVVLLMRLDDAIRQRRNIYAVIRGTTVNNDADLSVGFTAPSIHGQVRMLQRAYQLAGVPPEEIGYVEAHGTGTIVGDATELGALTRVFRGSTEKVGFCALGSVKSNIGHLSAASGVAGLMKAALVAKYGVIPGQPHFETPHSDFELETSPFYINSSTIRWPEDARPRRAAVSSFGVGGTNAHIVLEEPPSIQSTPTMRGWHAMPFSARDREALSQSRAAFSAHLGGDQSIELADVAYTLATGRKSFDHRSVLICRNREESIPLLEGPHPEQVISGRISNTTPAVCFMFPGQGTQFAKMGRELYLHEPTFRQHADEGLALLRPHVNFDLSEVLYGGGSVSAASRVLIQQTEVAQPALFITGYALTRLLESLGIRPRGAIGHSIGEYLAACLAGVMSLSDALRLVAARGRLMQALPIGGMLSVAMASEDLRHHLLGGLDIAAVNSPEQCVVSGPVEEIQALEEQFGRERVPCRRLQTSHAFHSRMMEPMLPEFLELVRTVRMREPSLPYISNVTGEFITEQDVANPDYWAEHIRRPVLFAKGFEQLLERGFDNFVEIGPGRALTSLAQQCGAQQKGRRLTNMMPTAGGGHHEQLVFLRGLALMWTSGVEVQWNRLYGDEPRKLVSLPTYAFQRQRYWVEDHGTKPHVGSIAADEKQPLEEWFYFPAWFRLPPSTVRKASDSPATDDLLFVGNREAGDAFVTQLGQPADRSLFVIPGERFEALDQQTYAINPEIAEDYHRLRQALRERAFAPTRVLHAWTASPGLNDLAGWERAQLMGLYSLQRLLRELRSDGTEHPLEFVIVSSGLAEVTGDEDLCPANASLLSFSKIAPLEHVNLRCRVIDVASPSPQMFTMVSNEVKQSNHSPFIAIRGTHRWEHRVERVKTPPIPDAKSKLKVGGTYLILGALGNIGLELADHLAKKWKANLILVSRTPLPDREDWATDLNAGLLKDSVAAQMRRLLEIEANASGLWTLPTDVADEQQMASLKAKIEERGFRLDGILYAAGRHGSSLSASSEEGLDEFRRHMRAKAVGTQNLIRVFGSVPLDFCVIFSSISTVAPAIGQCAYTAANHVADVLIWERNRTASQPWITCNWDLWWNTNFGWTHENFKEWRHRETSIGAKDAATKVARAARLALSPAEGVEALERVLGIDAGHVLISAQDLERRIQASLAPVYDREDDGGSDPEATNCGRPDLDIPYSAPIGDLEIGLANIWQETLGVSGLGRDDDFFDLGGHSLMAVRIVSKIKLAFQVELRLEEFMEASTIAKLAKTIEGPRPTFGEEKREPRTSTELFTAMSS